MSLFSPPLGRHPGRALGTPLPLFPADNWWNARRQPGPPRPRLRRATSRFIGGDRRCTPTSAARSRPGASRSTACPTSSWTARQPKKAVSFDYADESDGVDAGALRVPFYPIPDEAITQAHWIEGGAAGQRRTRAATATC